MNITNSNEFNLAIEAINNATIIVPDTETNTLRVRQQEKMPLVSIQLHLPETDQTFNFSFRHGYGDLLTSDGFTIRGDEDVLETKGRDRRAVYWMRLYNYWLKNSGVNMGNLPIEWLDALKKALTPDKKYIFHNANFDLTVLQREGFQPMPNVEDTMIALQVVWGDWGGKRNRDDKGIRVKMPDRYYDPEQSDRDGLEWGNRRLKWQARFWNLDNADAGEKDLEANAKRLQYDVVEYAVECTQNDPNLHDYLFPLGSYATWRKNPYSRDKEGIAWTERQISDTLSKVSWNSKELKGRMWMLPSDYMLKYGELDVILTSQLRENCLHVIDGWGCREIYEELNDINMTLAWRMENTGVLIDVEEANRRIAENYAEADAIMAKYDWNIDSWQAFKANVGDYLGLPDTKADTVRKALDWIEPDKHYEGTGGYSDYIMGAEAIQVINDRLEYKSLIKSTSTYLGRWVNNVDNDNRGHFYIDIAGTKTGRGTSGGDMGNGQNIPDRKATVKEVIIAPEGQLLWAIDYSNLELRIAAWIAEMIYGFAGSTMMTDVINREDAHSFTAEMLGVRDIMYTGMSDAEIAAYVNMSNWEQLDPETLKKLVYKFFIRQAGKTGNFNLIYGGSKYSLGIQMGEDFETGEKDEKKHWDIVNERFEPYEKLYNGWHELFPAFNIAADHFQKEAITPRPTPKGIGSFQYTMTHIPYARSEGRPVNDFRYGRPIKHHLYDKRWMPKKYGHGTELVDVKLYSTEKAWNNMVQGTAGHICFASGANFYKYHDHEGVEAFVNIHDALDGYADVQKLKNVVSLMKVMSDWGVEPALEVELEASLDNWQNMREVKDLELWVDSNGREGYD